MRKLVGIREVDAFPLYDIFVKNDHCFELSNGVIAHNSMYGGLVMSGGCLAKGTQIIMDDGSLKPIDQIKKSDKVLTHNRNFKPVNETFQFSDKELFEIEFEDGLKVVCSSDHKFLVDNEWICAKDLKVDVDCMVVKS